MAQPPATTVDIHVTLTDEAAWQYAHFFKRVCLSDYRTRATCDLEAHTMLHAGERIRKALAEKGFAPR